MKFIYNSSSICEDCYKHLDCDVVEENKKIWILKKCSCSDEKKYLVEDDADFFHSLKYTKLPEYYFNVLLVEVSDKCNLTCPHCYHIPDNRKKDRPISSIIEQFKSVPDSIEMFILAGAEPTMRNDLDILINEIKINFPTKKINLLTNGLKLSNLKYVENLKKSGLDGVFIGLNHKTYQGIKSRNKQKQAIINCLKFDIKIDYIGYTLESFNDLEEVVIESQALAQCTNMVRIRMGSDIGRSPGEGHKTLSQIFYKIKDISQKLKMPFEILEADNNIYHIMVRVGHAKLRIIQWPDIKNIVMEELRTGPWCNFYEGPITNFVHQVITRDIIINQGFTINDCHEKYTYKQP